MIPDANNLVKTWVRPEVLDLTLYRVPDATGLIKLDAMENPYPWPKSLRQNWTEALHAAKLNRYPDPQARALKTRLREVFQIPAMAALLVGNGSDEIIQMLALLLSGEGRVLLTVEPGFAMYRVIARLCGLEYVAVPLEKADFSLRIDAMLEAIQHHRPALVFLAYPNNPTGNLFDCRGIERIIREAPGLVVIDEAYSAFTDASFISDVGKYANLAVMRTLSKIGFAGLRLGVLAAPAAWVEVLEKVRLPYNVSSLSQLSAECALQRPELFVAQVQELKRQRASLYGALCSMPGIEAFPSEANFILFRSLRIDADQLFENLIQAGILVKNLNHVHAILRDCLRVTVGTKEENEAFITAIEKTLV